MRSKRALFVSFTTLFLLPLTACREASHTASHSETKVTNGVATARDEYPGVVLLQIRQGT